MDCAGAVRVFSSGRGLLEGHDVLIGPPEKMAPRGERELLVLVLTLLRAELEDDMPSTLVRELVEYAQLLATSACGVDT